MIINCHCGVSTRSELWPFSYTREIKTDRDGCQWTFRKAENVSEVHYTFSLYAERIDADARRRPHTNIIIVHLTTYNPRTPISKIMSVREFGSYNASVPCTSVDVSRFPPGVDPYPLYRVYTRSDHMRSARAVDRVALLYISHRRCWRLQIQ